MNPEYRFFKWFYFTRKKFHVQQICFSNKHETLTAFTLTLKLLLYDNIDNYSKKCSVTVYFEFLMFLGYGVMVSSIDIFFNYLFLKSYKKTLLIMQVAYSFITTF